MKKRTEKVMAKKRLIIESFLALMILLAPFIYKFHEYFPTEESVESIDFLWFTIGKFGFQNVESHVWFFLTKFIPLYLLAIYHPNAPGHNGF